jgi:hypothetical protein
MNLEKLKDTARKLEQKEDWRKAIDVYLKAIQQAESGAETSPDLSLYNRVGDLYLKINDTAEAVRSYERAVDLYADQGFFNNAIALCGKILRVNPGRTQTYLKLCQLHARKNVVSEAKRNLIEFLERMNALGQLSQAFQAVKLFTDQFSGSQEIRSMLVELLRATSRGDEAREQLEKMAQDLEASGDKGGARKTRDRLHGVEGDHQATGAAAGPIGPKRGDLVFLDTGIEFSTGPAARGMAAPPPRLTKEPEPEPEPILESEPALELEAEPVLLSQAEPVLVTEAEPETEVEPILLQDALITEDPVAAPEPLEDLIVDPLMGSQIVGMGAESLLGLDPLGSEVTDEPLEPMPDLTAPLGLQRDEPADLDFEPMTLEGMENASVPGFSPESGAGIGVPGHLLFAIPEPEAELEAQTTPVEAPLLRPDVGADSLLEEIPEAGLGENTESDDLANLENRVLDDPENPKTRMYTSSWRRS